MTRLKSLAAIALLGTLLATSAHAGGTHRSPHAVTLWWVIFNQPQHCMTDPGGVERCGGVDVFGQSYLDSVAAGSPDPSLIMPNQESGLAVIYATGGVTDRRGRVRLAASIYRTAEDALELGGTQVVDPMGLGRAFSNRDAEIHLVLRDHGRRKRGGTLAQITNFLDPFCSDPALGVAGGRNVCKDVQFAAYAPQAAGRERMTKLSDGKGLRRSAAYLYRQGDMLQAVVDTTLGLRGYGF